MNIDLLKERERNAYLQMRNISRKGAEELLRELGEACGEVEYIEDYAWLNMAIVRWDLYLKSEFDKSYLFTIKKPRKELKRHILVCTGDIKQDQTYCENTRF